MTRRVSGDGERPVVVATFPSAWEADLSRQCLTDAGIPAWVETAGLDNPYRLAAWGTGMIRLLVPRERADEARSVLDDLAPVPEEPDAEWAPANGGRPLWVRVAGGVLLAGLIIGAIPHGLRTPVALVALAGWLIWRRLALRRPVRSHDDASGQGDLGP